MNSISFYPTRRKNSDLFIYYRNEIAHAEFENDVLKYEGLASNIDGKLINKLIEVLNCVIRHEGLNRKLRMFAASVPAPGS